MIEMIAALSPMPAPAHGHGKMFIRIHLRFEFAPEKTTQRNQLTDDADYEPGLRRGE
jgi:hypothetical protein